MQLDYNQFIKDNFDFEKFDKLKIEDITKGGKRDYLPLEDYKALNSKISKTVQKEINTILTKYTRYIPRKNKKRATFLDKFVLKAS